MSEKNGGYAFPRMPISGNAKDYGGMTLRDHFAGQALPSVVAAFMSSGGAWDDYDDMAKSVWSIAEAMLKAREAK